MTIAPFPHRYVVSLASGELHAPPRAPVPAGAPPQFGGRDTVWSPEELLVGAALLCLETTFAAYARRAGLDATLTGTATGTLEKTASGPAFSSITIDVEMRVNGDDEAARRARDVLLRAERDCIVARALRVPVTIASSTLVREARTEVGPSASK
jgi:organic hydroperoxide reductase OsmC/OhrA